MLGDRTKLEIGAFRQALATLREAADMTETTIVRDALIQRFEYTFEAAWRAAGRALQDLGVNVTFTPGQVLKEALAAKLIDDPDAWAELQKARNKTSHAYKKKIAIEVAALVRSRGLADFETLLKRLEALK